MNQENVRQKQVSGAACMSRTTKKSLSMILMQIHL